MSVTLAELTGDPSDKSDEELWALVREACRVDTPTWRAYERLHGKYRMAHRQLGAPPLDDGVHRIAVERRRQVEAERFTAEHDAMWTDGELAMAAAAFAASPEPIYVEEVHPGPLYKTVFRHAWPWSLYWWKPKDRMRNVVRAGALIAAEIDRLLALPPGSL